MHSRAERQRHHLSEPFDIQSDLRFAPPRCLNGEVGFYFVLRLSLGGSNYITHNTAIRTVGSCGGGRSEDEDLC